MRSRVESVMRKSCKKAIIKMGTYGFPVRSYITEVILRSRSNGICIKGIYGELEMVGVNRRTTRNCLSVMLKDGEVELFWTSKGNERTRYKLSGI